MKHLRHRSLRLKLSDIISSIDFEQKVMENIRYCKNVCGETLKVIFWHNDLSETEIKNFIRRNEKSLFKINIEITKNLNIDAWFAIDSDGEEKTGWRYKWDGGILEGIVEYLKLIKHIEKKDS